MKRRSQQISQLLQAEMGDCIFRLGLPVIITVTAVELSPDLKNAKIFLSILGDDPEESFKEVLARKHEIIKILHEKKLKIKFFPHFDFYQDNSGEYSQKIDKLLEKI